MVVFVLFLYFEQRLRLLSTHFTSPTMGLWAVTFSDLTGLFPGAQRSEPLVSRAGAAAPAAALVPIPRFPPTAVQPHIQGASTP